MGGKKVGIVVFVICILLALLVVGISNIKVTKKETSTNSKPKSSQTSSVENSGRADTTEGVSATSLPSDAYNTTEVEDTASSDMNESYDSDSVVLKKIISEDKLSYAGADQVTTGVVKNKYCYLSGTQVVYCIDIDITMGTSGQVVQYYCTYTTYEGVSVGTKLSVTYKQTTDNTFALMSVSKV